MLWWIGVFGDVMLLVWGVLLCIGCDDCCDDCVGECRWWWCIVGVGGKEIGKLRGLGGCGDELCDLCERCRLCLSYCCLSIVNLMFDLFVSLVGCFDGFWWEFVVGFCFFDYGVDLILMESIGEFIVGVGIS